jgi:Carboxypeptidase regulatory-like domain
VTTQKRANEMQRPPSIPRRQLLFSVALLSGLIISAPNPSHSQNEVPQEQNQSSAQTTLFGPEATLHGIVRNAASGEPVPRALVRVNGDALSGTLTDSDGRFEIPKVPSGPQEVQVTKPGYLDQAEAGLDNVVENTHGYARNVIVAVNMPDVVFSMSPVNSIRGQVQLSTGDPAEGIQITLLKRTIQDGRVAWQRAANAKTNSEGIYRFGGLADGSYAVYTEPAMDSETATNLVEDGSGANVARSGYPSVFYPDSRDLAGAAKITISAGEQAQANISLALEPFLEVSASVTFPGSTRASRSSPDQSGRSISVQVMDAQGHQLPYSAQYDQSTNTAQAILPDGTYSLVAVATMQRVFAASPRDAAPTTVQEIPALVGQVDFTVAGHPATGLRLPLASSRAIPVQVSVVHSAASSSNPGRNEVFITLSQTGAWITDGMVMSFAQGSSDGTLSSSFVPPGTYWAHTSIAQKGMCEASLTAAGASLAREPLVLGGSGSTQQLNLSLRDDCASLTLSSPQSIASLTAGEEPFYIVFVVPDFDSTSDVVPQTLRPSTGGKIILSGLTPGNYHVYAFNRPVALEYRNPAALANLPSQTVTLSPSATSDLTVEAVQH